MANEESKNENPENQTPAEEESMQSFIQSIGQKWQTQLIAYLRKEMSVGRLERKHTAASLARRMLLAHQGAITMWKITGKLEYFDDAEQLFRSSIQ